VCLHTPRRFLAVGQWYDDFTQTTDDQIRTLLAAHGARATGSGADRPSEEGEHAE
jgi:putative phosphoribosyl transferase